MELPIFPWSTTIYSHWLISIYSNIDSTISLSHGYGNPQLSSHYLPSFPIPIGSVCMPYYWCAIYHQYTPVMLAYIYIYPTWILWDMVTIYINHSWTPFCGDPHDLNPRAGRFRSQPVSAAWHGRSRAAVRGWTRTCTCGRPTRWGWWVIKGHQGSKPEVIIIFIGKWI